MARVQRVQDSVHGLMEFEDMETSVIEVLRAKELQRLRRIRQLGLAHFVFPGAEHSRLVHCIGAAYLAIRFAKHLNQASREFLVPYLRPGPTAVRDLALAALFHDLGHGPLSHIWEKHVIGEDFDKSPWIDSLGLDGSETALFGLKWHELVTQGLLAWKSGELHRLLEQQEVGSTTRLRHFLLGNYYLTYLPRFISSDVDLDRSDFILRDAHQTGVAYGRYDLNWLVSTVTIGETSDNRLVVGFDMRKAPPVVEQFLVARRALYKTVYLHKTVRAAEAMIGLFLKRLKDVPEILEQPMVKIPLFQSYRKITQREALTPPEVLSLDDYSLWVLIQTLADSTTGDRTTIDLARRIISRDLFKLVPCDHSRLNSFMLRDDAYDRLYHAVRPYCKGEVSYYVCVDEAQFNMLCDNNVEWTYFIDTRSEERTAIPIREHELMRPHWAPEKIVRLFVPREAVDDALRAVEDKS